MIGKVLAACILLAAETYSVPTAVLLGIYHVEGGKVGVAVGPNVNGTYDLGPMQINTLWMPELAKIWGVSEETALRWVRDDPCTNAGVAAWILEQNIAETGDLARAIAYYHSRTPHIGSAYKERVVSSMSRHGLLR